jgi:dihydroorotase
VALEVLAAVFERHSALERLEAFTSVNGATFYGLPLNEGALTLVKQDWQVPSEIEGIVPFKAGETLSWRPI